MFYDEKDFDDMIAEATMERKEKETKIIESWCKEAGVKTPVGYYNDRSSNLLTIYTDKPGFMIGLRGKYVEKYTKMFEESFYYNDELKVKFVEVKTGFANYKQIENV